jgi:DNA-binding GntR family transcriptional regulator
LPRGSYNAAGRLRSAFPGTAPSQQVRADVLARVERGELAPGDELPSEPALAAAYGVGRRAVRAALADLTRAGVIQTERGIGRRVAPAPLRHLIGEANESLLDTMAGRGHVVRQLVLGATRLEVAAARSSPPRREAGWPSTAAAAGRKADEAADGDLGELFRFPAFPGPLVEYRYVRFVDDIPWSTSYAILPAALAPTSWDGSTSLFAALASLHGLRIRRGDRRLSAVPADPQDARWLEVAVGAPLLRLVGSNADQHDRVVGRIIHRIRGDRAEYLVRMPR